MSGRAGYRPEPRGGPRVRTDVVDVYVFRSTARGTKRQTDRGKRKPAKAGAETVEFLQLLRAGDPLGGTWQPVMGHVEPGETAVACALRELSEEIGLAASDPAFLGLWALEQVHPFYLAALDAIVLSPRLAAQVAPVWRPRLNHEHTDHRWVSASQIAKRFMWPGQIAACREVLACIVPLDSLARERLSIDIGPRR